MTPPPSRDTPGGRAYLDLRTRAVADNRPTQELLHLYALEGFLDRLVHSSHAERFVLKGGVLLAAFDTRRPTKDVDLYGRAVANDTAEIRSVIVDVLALEIDDGLSFDLDRITTEVIRDQDDYSGIRIGVPARLATANVAFHVDVNVGDPVWPAPERTELPRLLGGVITVIGYSLTLVHAEKLVTAISRGTINTRWRDFADVYVLSRTHQVDGSELVEAIARVAEHRQVQIVPLTEALDGYAEIGQAKWWAWRRRQQLDDRLPAVFGDVLDHVIGFADPAITGDATGQHWAPSTGWG